MDSQLIIPKESKANLTSTWNIYKSQWKTFIVLTGFLIVAYIIYSIIDAMLSLMGLAPMMYNDYDSYVGSGSLLISSLIRGPVYIVYSVITALLSVLFMVIPALYFKNKEIITWKVPFKVLFANFKRYFLAGLLYSVCVGLGFLLCIVPGIVISFIAPAYVNKIACSDMPIIEAFKSSFQAVYKSSNKWSYLGMSTLAALIYVIATACTCGIGSVITLPMLSIYSQHLAYNKGIIN